jgi:putative FmdB family regulatory protein
MDSSLMGGTARLSTQIRDARRDEALPTYEYACESCGNRYEKREGFDAKPRQKCPKCGKMAQRLLSTPAVVFKGSGFYKTDNRGSSGEAESKPSETPSATPATPAPAADGPDGRGGHSHDAPSPAKTKPDTSTTTSEAAAAG